MADLNHLKYINDTYGHKEGDDVMKKAAEVFKSSSRKEDIVTRYGGDEFIIFLSQVTEHDLKMICERIFAKCKEKGKSLSPGFGHCNQEKHE